MDFSKIKKIFYIVAIVSMLLSIKTKVFGASYSVEYQGVTFEFSDTFNQNTPYYCLFVSDAEIYGFYYACLVRSNDIITINNTTNPVYFYNNENTGITRYFGTLNQLATRLTNNTLSDIPSTGSSETLYKQDVSWSCVFTNHNLYNTDGTLFKSSDTFTNPFFDNTTEISNGYPDGVFISRGSYSEDETLYFHLLKITNTINDGNNTIYYYSPKIFALNKNSKYYRTYDSDVNNTYSYYYVNRASLSLDTDSSYLYVLSNSNDTFTTSYGILQADGSSGIYEVIQSNTTGVITPQDSTNDKIQNIDDTLNDNNVSPDTETNIEDSLNFDNTNEGLNNLNNGFFSRLTTMLSNLLGYNLAEDTSVSIPLPNSDKSIVLHSKNIYDNVTGALRLIINAFWVYIFTFYMWKFINKIYIAVSTGNILDTFSSSGEAITNDML